MKCNTPEKLVIKRVLSSKVRVEAYVDRTRAITHSSTTAVTFEAGTSLTYLAGVLNSRLVNLFVRDWMYNRTELTMNFREEYLGEIPVPKDPPPQMRERIEHGVALLERLSVSLATGSEPTVSLATRLVEAKKELDDAVYELYGLDSAQVEEVERLMPYSD